MEDEVLCEVDELDQVIGPRARGELHRLGLRHRAVHILLINGAGKLFLQRRSANKDINPGLWDSSAAGHVDYGEDYDDCARRELLEELGVGEDTGLERLGRLKATADTGWEFIQVYRVVHAGPLVLNPEEIVDGRWLAEDAVTKWIAEGGAGLTASFKVIWSLYQQRGIDG